MFKRILDLPALLTKKSFFLFGPRATGKSFLIRQQLREDSVVIDLLDNRVYAELLEKPHHLSQILALQPQQKTVVIDEVQRIPELLNEVHRLIEEKHYRFLLTGSSARRLRARGVNLLAGRAWEAQLFPLTMRVIEGFDLQLYLLYGGLPAVYQSEYPQEELQAYVKTYLQEEIQAEAFVRKVPAFTRFMSVASLTSGTMINFSSLANDVGLSPLSVREYYQILQDTFLGFLLPAWQKSQKRKPVATAKFYYFDLGVKNTLAGITALPKQSDLYGQAFEHFIAIELRAFLSYERVTRPLSYWRSQKGHEVDFIVGDDIAIEVKSTDHIVDKHLKHIKLLKEENICQQYYVISHDALERVQDGIHIMHWKTFLQALYNKQIIS